MKRRVFFTFLILILLTEIIALIAIAVKTPNFSQNTVAVNEVVKSVTKDFYNLDQHKNSTSLDYAVLDKDGTVLHKTKPNVSQTLNTAISHRDSIVDIEVDGALVGKIIIYNSVMNELQLQKKAEIIVLSVAVLLQLAMCVAYVLYIHLSIISPFGKMKSFAERIAGGNLDVPLEMDRRNLFGAFTESFDIMRDELKKARLAEAQAQQSKKELVAKLSHDIKTPVASIKAVAEVGVAKAENEKDGANYTQIINKADQINTLVTNLFTATLEELQQLTVTPTNMESEKVKALLENADYMHRAEIPEIPQCLLCVDRLRLQQVFDNIFANSYKYAKTDILVTAEKSEDSINIVIEDCGGGVAQEELPMLKEKFKRGSNSAQTEGAGLGLYISNYFMKEMQGELTIENGNKGLKVTVALPLSGKIKE